jgi:flagellar motor switch protein FliM
MAETELVKTEVEMRESMAKPGAPAQAKRPGMMQIDEHEAWPVLARLSIPLNAEIGLARFKVRDLLALETGQVIASEWPETEDVTVKAGGVQVGWSEFEVEDQKLLVRLTRLA